jgi:hypothetical protein
MPMERRQAAWRRPGGQTALAAPVARPVSRSWKVPARVTPQQPEEQLAQVAQAAELQAQVTPAPVLRAQVPPPAPAMRAMPPARAMEALPPAPRA